MRALALLLSVLLCASTAPAAAQDLVLDPWLLAIGSETPPAELMDPDDALIIELLPGDKATYEGVLLDTATAARWTARIVWYQGQLKLDADDLRRAMAKQHASDTRVRLGIVETYKAEIEGLRTDLRDQAKQFEAAKKVPFYKTWTFGFVTGIAASALVAAGAVKIAK